MKIIVRLISIAFLVVVFVVVMTVLQFKYFGPWQHIRNTEKAEAFNQTNWETGFADVYTVETAIELNDQMRSVSFEVICARKMKTAGVSLIDNAATIREGTHNFNSRETNLPISDDYQVIFDTQLSCDRLAKDIVGQEFPFSPKYQLSVSVQHISEPNTSCTIHLKGEAFQFETLRVFPVTILSARQERISSVLSRDEYGPADAALIRALESENPQPRDLYRRFDTKYYWSDENRCWHEIRGECAPRANTICSLTR